jgi:hypothetical protein
MLREFLLILGLNFFYFILFYLLLYFLFLTRKFLEYADRLIHFNFIWSTMASSLRLELSTCMAGLMPSISPTSSGSPRCAAAPRWMW